MGRNAFRNRFSGFIKLVDLVGSTKAIPSTFISYAINAQKFTNAIQPRSETVYNEATIVYDDISETKKETLKDDRFNQEKPEVPDFQEFDAASTKASFDCKILREYIEMNAGKPELLKVSNRDIIVKLGLKFEEMGENVLEQIRLQDPLFYRYYNSLLIIEEYPLN